MSLKMIIGKSLRFQALTLIFTALFLSSCEKQTEWTLQNYASESIVVDGTITDEYKTQEIKLMKPSINQNATPLTISGAELIVSTEDDVFHFHEDSLRPGYYLSDDLFAGNHEKTYSLIINADGNIISAKATLAEARDFVFVRYVRQSKTSLFRIQSVANAYNADYPAMYEITLDWSAVAGYEHESQENTKARLLYYTLPTIDVSQIFAPAVESILFPPGTIITEKRYSLTREHAAFIRALLSETSWQGGLFNSAPANLPTNLSNNGLGYFGACGVSVKTQIARSLLESRN